jgi:hypothetical protein
MPMCPPRFSSSGALLPAVRRPPAHTRHSGNALGFIFIVVENALRAGPAAHPPLSMHAAIVFQSVLVCASCFLVLGLRGKQVRRQLDEARARAGADAGLARARAEGDGAPGAP